MTAPAVTSPSLPAAELARARRRTLWTLVAGVALIANGVFFIYSYLLVQETSLTGWPTNTSQSILSETNPSILVCTW